MIDIKGVAEVALYVQDLNRAAAFYKEESHYPALWEKLQQES